MAFTCRPSGQATAELDKIMDENKFKTKATAIEHVLRNYRSNEIRLEMVEGELQHLRNVMADKARADREYHNLVANFGPQDGHPYWSLGQNGIKTGQKSS
ncbi:MAG TPA: hypothetical protein DHV36_09570 [Desulfobacteraceae bacterium]|nr:hypothetical protein [Desulfobacteraceae bacterium]|tara:strand:- start:419 stop:718 length:300 start_codon:yes stop_codon:yes gene_type:complete